MNDADRQTVKALKQCDTCESAEARYRLTLTTLDGEVLDWKSVCHDCAVNAHAMEPGAPR